MPGKEGEKHPDASRRAGLFSRLTKRGPKKTYSGNPTLLNEETSKKRGRPLRKETGDGKRPSPRGREAEEQQKKGKDNMTKFKRALEGR